MTVLAFYWVLCYFIPNVLLMEPEEIGRSASTASKSSQTFETRPHNGLLLMLQKVHQKGYVRLRLPLKVFIQTITTREQEACNNHIRAIPSLQVHSGLHLVKIPVDNILSRTVGRIHQCWLPAYSMMPRTRYMQILKVVLSCCWLPLFILSRLAV